MHHKKTKYLLFSVIFIVFAISAICCLYVIRVKKNAEKSGIPLAESELDSFFEPSAVTTAGKGVSEEYKKIHSFLQNYNKKNEYDSGFPYSVLRAPAVYMQNKNKQKELADFLNANKSLIQLLHKMYMERKSLLDKVPAHEDMIFIYQDALPVLYLYHVILTDALAKGQLEEITKIMDESFYFTGILGNIPYLLMQQRANTMILYWLLHMFYPYIKYTDVSPEKLKIWIAKLKEYNKNRVLEFQNAIKVDTFFFCQAMDMGNTDFNWLKIPPHVQVSWKPFSFFWEKIKMLNFATRLLNDFMEPEKYYCFKKEFIEFSEPYFKTITRDEWIHQKFNNSIEHYYQRVLFYLQGEFYVYTVLKANIVLTAALCYYQVHKRYPASIHELVPEFLDKTDIIDPLSGSNFAFSIDEKLKSVSVSSDEEITTLASDLKVKAHFSFSEKDITYFFH